MAVVEEKNKVQQVLDFRKLNKFVECGRSDVDACDEKLRSWRQKLPNSALLDLHDIYTKISVADECSKYQIVKFGGNFYKLSWLRFGLNCAPKIKKPSVLKFCRWMKRFLKQLSITMMTLSLISM